MASMNKKTQKEYLLSEIVFEEKTKVNFSTEDLTLAKIYKCN